MEETERKVKVVEVKGVCCVIDTDHHYGTPNYIGYGLVPKTYLDREFSPTEWFVLKTNDPELPYVRYQATPLFVQVLLEAKLDPTIVHDYNEYVCDASGLHPGVVMLDVPFYMNCTAATSLCSNAEKKMMELAGAKGHLTQLCLVHPEGLNNNIAEEANVLDCHKMYVVGQFGSRLLLNTGSIVSPAWSAFNETVTPMNMLPAMGDDEFSHAVIHNKKQVDVQNFSLSKDGKLSLAVTMMPGFFNHSMVPAFGGVCRRPVLDCKQFKNMAEILAAAEVLKTAKNAEE